MTGSGRKPDPRAPGGRGEGELPRRLLPDERAAGPPPWPPGSRHLGLALPRDWREEETGLLGDSGAHRPPHCPHIQQMSRPPLHAPSRRETACILRNIIRANGQTNFR